MPTVKSRRFDPRRVNALFSRVGRQAAFGKWTLPRRGKGRCQVCLVTALLMDAGVDVRSIAASDVDTHFGRVMRTLKYSYDYTLGLVRGWDKADQDTSSLDGILGYQDGQQARELYLAKHADAVAP